MASYLLPIIAVAGISAVCLLLAWVAWLLFNWRVFKSADRKPDVFAKTAKVAEAFGRSKVTDSRRMPAIGSLRRARQPRQRSEPPTAA